MLQEVCAGDGVDADEVGVGDGVDADEVGVGDTAGVEVVDDDGEVFGVGSLDCPSPSDLKREVSKKIEK